MEVLVLGSIPASSGLSSSSALVSAAALATSYANKVNIKSCFPLSYFFVSKRYIPYI